MGNCGRLSSAAKNPHYQVFIFGVCTCVFARTTTNANSTAIYYGGGVVMLQKLRVV